MAEWRCQRSSRRPSTCSLPITARRSEAGGCRSAARSSFVHCAQKLEGRLTTVTALACQHRLELRDRLDGLRRRGREDDAGTGEQRGEDLFGEDVEAGAGELQDAVRGSELEQVEHGEAVVDQRPVRHGHRLRASGRTAGEDHVGELLGASGSRLIAAWRGLRRPAGRSGAPGPGGVQPRRQPLVRQREPGLGVGEHELEPPARLARVERQVGSAGLEDAQDGSHQLGATRQQDGHHRAGTDAVGAKAWPRPRRPRSRAGRR